MPSLLLLEVQELPGRSRGDSSDREDGLGEGGCGGLLARLSVSSAITWAYSGGWECEP